MESQDNSKQINVFFRSKYVKLFLCSSLVSCFYYFWNMFIRRMPIEADIYLALNLVVPAVLWFLIGLALNRWAEKAPDDKVPAFKIAFVVVVLVFIYPIVSAIVIRHSETVVPIVGDWLTFSLSARYAAVPEGGILGYVFSASILDWIMPLLALLFCIFIYRFFCFYNLISKRMLAVFVIVWMTGIFSGRLADVFFWGSLNFITVRNFIGLGLIDIYDYAVYFFLLRLLLESKKPSQSKEVLSEFKAYLKYETDNIKAVVSKLRKGKR